jgi:hypothetical protein
MMTKATKCITLLREIFLLLRRVMRDRRDFSQLLIIEIDDRPRGHPVENYFRTRPMRI